MFIYTYTKILLRGLQYFYRIHVNVIYMFIKNYTSYFLIRRHRNSSLNSAQRAQTRMVVNPQSVI